MLDYTRLDRFDRDKHSSLLGPFTVLVYLTGALITTEKSFTELANGFLKHVKSVFTTWVRRIVYNDL